MAKIDPLRRAEIGREKRARTRAQLVAAANSLYARQAVETVTVDDVVREAEVAKGTFYVHFTGLDALNAAVAEELVRSLDELLQPVRLSLDDPALRIAFGCSSFIDKALDDARWGALTSKFLLATPQWGEVVRRRLLEDLQQLSKALPRGEASAELNLEIVIGIILQLTRALGQGRLSFRDRNPAIAAILRAIGLDARQTRSVLARLPAPQRDASRTRSGRSKPQPKRTTDSAA
ncbi:TetR/AcrR family transcriptional regulator [Microvirga sp. KLBC 81]|uniref:TetR/AcrR family transcriptional regulator n=1 Tax=Microvirga sp. KLBC 81 TaxID=1862707 RepID=UPI000D50B3A5|nr:TetR/AcrR family transcriptional regulator [Microvirga sp. KLBC 81]PVE21696.1 TetR/AcrR family transcriptional regulator [Microvirga sp. KLBC 81]